MNTFTAQEQRLLELIQTNFPCTSRPYQTLAQQLGTSEQEVLAFLRSFKEHGILRQISAIFDAKALGFSSTLAAFRIDEDKLDAAAEIINAHPGVSHNYQRGHRFNLWFTLSVPQELDLTGHIQHLARKTSCSQFLNLPALRMFKRRVYLRFNQQQPEHRIDASQGKPGVQRSRCVQTEVCPPDVERCLMRELQKDLPLSPTPFYDIASRCDVKEETVLRLLTALQTSQKMRRFAAILRHKKVGFTANAMVVWNIPTQEIEGFTDYAVTYDAISHCYERPGTLVWPYNIYTMIHGKTRDDTEQIIADVAAHCEGTSQYEALYTLKEYKKQRVDYFSKAFYEWDRQQNEHLT